jgi:hypothetical protein
MKPTRWVTCGSARGEALGGDCAGRLAGALHEQSRQRWDGLDQRHRIKAVRFQYCLALQRHDEGREAIRHRLGVEDDHAIDRADGEVRRQRNDGKAGHFVDGLGAAAAIGEGNVGAVRQENAFDGALAGDERGCPGPAAVKLLRLGLERRAGAGMHGLGAREHRPGIVAGGVCARRGGRKAHGRIEQPVQHVGGGETSRAVRQGAQAVAREVDHEALRMAGREALRLPHVRGPKEIDVGARLDLLAHQARRPEFGRCHRVRAGRKPPEQVGKRGREAARSRHVQRVRHARGCKQAQRDQPNGKSVMHDFLG